MAAHAAGHAERKSRRRLDPLSGYRVVELSRGPAAAFCARQFAVWGADVVIVEPEGGSPLRRLRPCVTDASGAERSLLWTYLAANKRSLGSATKESLTNLWPGPTCW